MKIGVRAEFRLLGPVDVVHGTTPVTLNRKQRSLLAILLLNANRVTSIERLTAALWHDPQPAAAPVRVRTLVFELRRALRAVGDDLIVTRSPGYLLRVQPGELDLDEFTQRVELARKTAAAKDLESAVDQFDEALLLWRGQPLEDTAGPLLEVETERLAERRWQAIEERTETMLALGRHAEVILEVGGFVAQHPSRELPHAQLMRALHRSGRRSEALTVYRHLRAHLIDSLGVEPTLEMRRLHQQLLTDAPELDLTRPHRRTRPSRLLPAAPSRFIGRRRELGMLDELATGPGRLLLIVGAGGVGKTTACVHWAYQRAERFPDGVLFLDLRGFDRNTRMDVAEALPRLIHALGVPTDKLPPTVEAQQELYRTMTADQHLLLVLDNAAEPDQVRPLLPSGPRCLTLVTSRDRLSGLVALDGASRVTLDVLPPDAAVDVLLATAGGDRGDDRSAALQLAKLCGYLPLALAITGARLADQPYRTIRDQIAELTANGRMAALSMDDDPRADVRHTFGLSYQHLPAATKRLFRLLGMVAAPDGWTSAAAAALAGVSRAEAAALLDTLSRVHLTTPVAADRYTCHDLVLDYAAELASAEETAPDRDAAVRRLLDFYLHTTDNSAATVFGGAGRLPRDPCAADARPLCFDDVVQARAWMADEWGNVIAAFRHAATVGLRPVAAQLADALRAMVRLGLSIADLHTVAQNGLAVARAADDVLAEAAMHHLLSQVRLRMTDYPGSLEHCEQALARYRAAGWPAGESMVLRSMGGSLMFLGQIDAGIVRLTEALAIARETGDRFNEAVTLTNMAAAHLERGDLVEATRLHELALPALIEAGHRHGEAVARSNLGLVLHAQGRLDEALESLHRALAICQAVGGLQHEASAQISIGTVQCDAGRLAAARSAHLEGLRLAGEVGDDRLAVFAHNGLARTEIRLGRPDEAEARLTGFLDTLTDARDLRGRVEALLALSNACSAVGRYREARDHAEEALERSERVGFALTVNESHAALATALLRLGDVAGCLDHGTRALRGARRTGQRLTQARALAVLAEGYSLNGQAAAARTWRTHADAMFAEVAADGADCGP